MAEIQHGGVISVAKGSRRSVSVGLFGMPQTTPSDLEYRPFTLQLQFQLTHHLSTTTRHQSLDSLPVELQVHGNHTW